MSGPALRTALEEAFAAERRRLWALLYRMTGSGADADDLLQECFARALERDPDPDRPLSPWLTRVAVNGARDLLRARRRRGYVGPWLPEPVDLEERDLPALEPRLPDGESAAGRYDLLESVSFAFLLALEALNPVQRAVLLLRDVFDYSVAETAGVLGLSADNTKQIHLRARRRMQAYRDQRPAVGTAHEAATLAAISALVQCVAQDDVAGVEALLAQDVCALNDGAGRYVAARRPLHGPRRVARFLAGVARKRGLATAVELRRLNGAPALLLSYPSGRRHDAARAVFALELDRAGRIWRVYSLLADEKLARLTFPG